MHGELNHMIRNLKTPANHFAGGQYKILQGNTATWEVDGGGILGQTSKTSKERMLD